MNRRNIYHIWSILLAFASLMLASHLFAAEVVLRNNVGTKCVISEQPGGYALGSIYVNGQLVERPLLEGMMKFKDTATGTEYWLYASEYEKISDSKAVFSGKGSIGGAKVTFQVTMETPPNVQAVRITYDYSVNRNIKNRQACLLYHNDFDHTWKSHMYPFAGDATYIQRDPLSWMGIPSLFMYRRDRSLGLLWGIDPNSDYLNPTTWTKDFGLYFIDGVMPAQFRVGGDGLRKKIDYHIPMQIILTDTKDPDGMILDLMDNWMRLNRFKADDLYIRSHDEALNLFIEGRRNTNYWNPGMGYRLGGARFIYMGEQGLAAYFDYLLYEMTGDPVWRERAFEQMDFILKAQNTDPEHPNFGYIQTTYSLAEGYGPSGIGFNSDDRGTNIGWKPGINAHIVRYMLRMWELVKEREGIDRQDWYESAINSMNWVVRQQNWDGGLPQNIEPTDLQYQRDADWMGTNQPERVLPAMGKRSPSAASGRALPAITVINKIVDDPRYKQLMTGMEAFALNHVQNDYWFTGHHPDLPPQDFEEASIWGVCEFWLNRYDDTGDPAYLKHAEANVALALTWMCPKQLSWVDNPTQFCSAEQEHYFTYTLYCYQNRKIECLQRLYDLTSRQLYDEMRERILQGIYFTQTTGKDDRLGGTYERTSDPWLARPIRDGKPDFNSLGPHYMNEQSLDTFLQTLLLYRQGNDLYMGPGLDNKLFPDGTCYYNRDISRESRVDLAVIPSEGIIHVQITAWNTGHMNWTVQEGEGQQTLTHVVSGLQPDTRYAVMINGQLYKTYKARADGKINFEYSGEFTDAQAFMVEEQH